MGLLLTTEQPQLVILDLILPGTNGFELLKRIRDVSRVPVIFLSGHDRNDDVVKALSSGADDYILKPSSSSELVARIEASLRKHGTRDQSEVRKPYRLKGLLIDYAVEV